MSAASSRAADPWALLLDVLGAAYSRASDPDQVQLLDVLKAHRRVCLARAVRRPVADEAYRTILRLSLDQDPDWWAKLDSERQVSPARDTTACLPTGGRFGSLPPRSGLSAARIRPDSIGLTPPRPESYANELLASIACRVHRPRLSRAQCR